MKIKIGEKIKLLRKKMDITQEKLANYLGITPQAISRWESTTAYPDIDIIPSIANFFNITADELLGIDIERKREKINKIEELIAEKAIHGLIDDELEICRQAINEFPNDYGLLNTLAQLLDTKSDKIDICDKKKSCLMESISIRERILEDSANDNLRWGILQGLAYAYDKIGNKEKAVEIANKLPFFYNTNNVVLGGVLDGEKRVNQLRQNIWMLTDLLTEQIGSFARIKFSSDYDIDKINKRIELYKKMIKIIEVILENGDYAFNYIRIKEYYSWMAEDYILVKNFESALDCVEKAAMYAEKSDKLPEIFTHTSIIFDGDIYEISKHTLANVRQSLIEELSKKNYEPLKNIERFRSIIENLQK